MPAPPPPGERGWGRKHRCWDVPRPSCSGAHMEGVMQKFWALWTPAPVNFTQKSRYLETYFNAWQPNIHQLHCSYAQKDDKILKMNTVRMYTGKYLFCLFIINYVL